MAIVLYCIRFRMKVFLSIMLGIYIKHRSLNRSECRPEKILNCFSPESKAQSEKIFSIIKQILIRNVVIHDRGLLARQACDMPVRGAEPPGPQDCGRGGGGGGGVPLARGAREVAILC